MFPSAMEPPVLCGVLADKLFNRRSVFLCNPEERVLFIFPLVGHDYSIYADFKIKPVINSSAVTYSDWYVVLHCEQTDALISRGLASEEINEDAFSSCVLVGDEADSSAGFYYVIHHCCGPFFVDDFLACVSSNAVEVFTDVAIIERSGN